MLSALTTATQRQKWGSTTEGNRLMVRSALLLRLLASNVRQIVRRHRGVALIVALMLVGGQLVLFSVIEVPKAPAETPAISRTNESTSSPRVASSAPSEQSTLQIDNLAIVFSSDYRAVTIRGGPGMVRLWNVTPRVTIGIVALALTSQEVESLTIEGAFIEADALTPLHQMPHLKSVLLFGTNATDRHLRDIVQCRGLENLTIHGGAITEDTLPLLCRSRKLRHVVLQYQHFVSRTAAQTLHFFLPSAYILIDDVEISKEGVAGAPSEVRKRLDVDLACGGKSTVSAAGVMIRLNRLMLTIDAHAGSAIIQGVRDRGVPELSEEVMSLLNSYHHAIKTLKIRDVVCRDNAMAIARSMPALTEVELQDCNVWDADVSNLSACSTLERVTINRGMITENSLYLLGRIRGLRYLNVADNPFVAINAPFKRLKQLRPNLELVTGLQAAGLE